MGGGRYSDKDWSTYTSTKSARTSALYGVSLDAASANQIYEATALAKALDPRTIKVRESRDSADNPTSTAIIVALDVTGSMAPVLEYVAKTGLKALCAALYDKRPVPDPHIMCLGIGDVEFDRAPLQATQFEADIRIAEQLEQLYFERGGGGNSYESYSLAWLFAAQRCKTDCFEKRGKRGYLITVGDELPTTTLDPITVKAKTGLTIEAPVAAAEALALASTEWNVFHVVVEQGGFARGNTDRVANAWAAVVGQRVLRLSQIEKLAETIVSAIALTEGAAVDWDPATAEVVRRATAGLSGGSGGVVEL